MSYILSTMNPEKLYVFEIAETVEFMVGSERQMSIRALDWDKFASWLANDVFDPFYVPDDGGRDREVGYLSFEEVAYDTRLEQPAHEFTPREDIGYRVCLTYMEPNGWRESEVYMHHVTWHYIVSEIVRRYKKRGFAALWHRIKRDVWRASQR